LLGPWPYQSHVAFDDVPELWQLIEMRKAQKPTKRGDAWIVCCCGPNDPRLALLHAAQLVHPKDAPSLACSVLDKENWPAHQEQDCEPTSGYQDYSRQSRKSDKQKIRRPLDRGIIRPSHSADALSG
jgi:hypothetical protein